MSHERAAGDQARKLAYQSLAAVIPEVGPAALLAAEREVLARTIPYPFGSGQGDEIAFRAGLKPMFRELLPVRDIPAAQERFAKAGFATHVAERVYGDTKDGWDDTIDALDAQHPQARQSLFIGRESASLQRAAHLDQEKTDAADQELGRLLGYPACCVEAFLGSSRQRKAPELHRAALAATQGVPAGRLNTLDLATFHYLPWYPCQLRCPWSLAYADKLAAVIASRAPSFAEAIDAALAMPRLLLSDELQLSLHGEIDGNTVQVRSIVPSAQHRHPRATLEQAEASLLASLLAWLRTARQLVVERDALVADGHRLALPFEPLLVPFSLG